MHSVQYLEDQTLSHHTVTNTKSCRLRSFRNWTVMQFGWANCMCCDPVADDPECRVHLDFTQPKKKKKKPKRHSTFCVCIGFLLQTELLYSNQISHTAVQDFYCICSIVQRYNQWCNPDTPSRPHHAPKEHLCRQTINAGDLSRRLLQYNTNPNSHCSKIFKRCLRTHLFLLCI